MSYASSPTISMPCTGQPSPTVVAASEESYRARVQAMSGRWPGLDVLSIQIERCDVKISTLEILDSERFEFSDIPDPCPRRSDHLYRILHGPYPRCLLFIVENPCLDVITMMGGTLNVDPCFWASHLNNVPWYRTKKPSRDSRNILPSSQKEESFLHLRIIHARDWRRSEENDMLSVCTSVEDNTLPSALTRKAGLLRRKNPSTGDPSTVALTRQRLTSWFCNANDSGWVGILAFDPQFEPKRGYGSCEKSLFLDFLGRPQLDEPLPDPVNRESFHDTFQFYLKGHLQRDPKFLVAAISEAFLVTVDAYRITAAEWQLLIEYYNRELVTIEWELEKGTGKASEDLETHIENLESDLKNLFAARRRCTQYLAYIDDARSHCVRRGQCSWPHANTSIAFDESQSLKEDFDMVHNGCRDTNERIDKDIELITALVAIAEGKVGLEKNKGIGRLTLIAVLFIPFSTVATVLAMQGRFAPGADRFFVLFAVAIPIVFIIWAFFKASIGL